MTPLKFMVILITLFTLISAAVGIYVYSLVAYGLPSLDQLENPKQSYATQVISADGEVLDHFFEQRRIQLPLDSIPKNFIDALIAVEDREFFNHWGVHFGRVMKAAVKNVFFGKMEGASTITMQLSRNLFFSQDRSLKRKVREAFAAVQIEKTFTKEEILELYANTVIFGRGAYGIQVASQVYFNKQPMELTLGECAFLVGILKNPEHYNGLKNYQKALMRRNLVLRLMFQEEFITRSQFVEAVEEPINLAKANFSKKRKNYMAPHFVEMIRRKLGKDERLRDYDLYRDGLRITSTLNTKIQDYAEEAVKEHLDVFQSRFSKNWSWNRHKKLLDNLVMNAIYNAPEYIAATTEAQRKKIIRKLENDKKFIESVKSLATTVQVGFVALDPMTGEILAMVGASPKFMDEAADTKYSLNHSVQISRDPGSSFKPYVYASALRKGLNMYTMIECGPYSYKDPVTNQTWSPRGSGGCEPGDMVPLHKGLSSSINTVAARLITKYTTPAEVIRLAVALGITSPMSNVPSLALGSGVGTNPLAMASAYGAFVNDGIRVTPYYIRRVEDQQGNVLFENNKIVEARDVLRPLIAHQMTKMLKGVVDHGTAWRVKQEFTGCEAAGKTGTTNDYADAWFVGFTPQLVAAVWVGFDDMRISFTGEYGYAASAAVPVWAKFMKKVYSDTKLPYKQKQFNVSALDSVRFSPNSIINNENGRNVRVNESDDEYSNPHGFPSLNDEEPN